MGENQSKISREISSVSKYLESLRRFYIVIVQHQVLLDIIAFKVLICIMY